MYLSVIRNTVSILSAIFFLDVQAIMYVLTHKLNISLTDRMWYKIIFK